MNISAALPIISGANRGVRSWAAKLARLGLAARGIVYVMVGYLAAASAAGIGGKPTDKQGALQAIARLPMGDLVLWFVAVGLLGYVVWRFAQAILDLDGNGTDAKAWGKRAASLCSGLAYAALSMAALAAAARIPALKIGSGARGAGGGDGAAQHWTAWLLSQPMGAWLVGLVAAVIAGLALYQFYQAISCKFTKHLRGRGLTSRQELFSRRAGQMGYVARGIAFALIAAFLMNAATQDNARKAGGLAQAFQTLSEQSHGSWLVGIVGGGFALFGVFSLIEAHYRRIRG